MYSPLALSALADRSQEFIVTRLTHLSVIVLLASLAGHAMALEKPKYRVVFEAGKIEYRIYESYLVAETTVTGAGSYGEASNQGFFRLFDYISGDNSGSASIAMTSPVQQIPTSEKISMTAPVQQTRSGSGWTVAFMLPSKFDLKSAPTPTNPEVRIRVIPERMMAAVKYSGRWTQKNFDRQTEKLMKDINARDIAALSTPEAAVYNPPFVPPFMRRNEIMIEVDRYPGLEKTSAKASASKLDTASKADSK